MQGSAFDFQRGNCRKEFAKHLFEHKQWEDNTLLQYAQCLAKFQKCGWIDYFLKLDGFNEGISLEFSKTFSEGKAIVKGLEVVAIEERIA